MPILIAATAESVEKKSVLFKIVFTFEVLGSTGVLVLRQLVSFGVYTMKTWGQVPMPYKGQKGHYVILHVK